MTNKTQKNNFFYHICGGCYYGRNDNWVAEFHAFVRSFICGLGSGNLGVWQQASVLEVGLSKAYADFLAPHISRRDGLNVSGFLGGCALNNDRKNDAGFGFGFAGGRGFTSPVFYSICGGLT